MPESDVTPYIIEASEHVPTDLLQFLWKAFSSDLVFIKQADECLAHPHCFQIPKTFQWKYPAICV
jgi:hypothetical protein